MFQEELKKIFRGPLKWALILVFMLNIAIIFINYFEFRHQVGNVKKYNEFADQYEGVLDQVFAEQCKNNVSGNMGIDKDGDMDDSAIDWGQRGRLYFYSDYWMSSEAYKAWNKVEGEPESKPVSYEGIKKYLDYDGNRNDPVYPIKEMEFQMLSKTGAPNYYYNIVGIKNIVRTLTGGMISFFLIIIVLILIVSSAFSVENSSNMSSIILTAANGRKEILKAKIAVVQLTSWIWISLYYWVCVVLYLLLFDNFGKLSVPLNAVDSFYKSPYNMKIWQFLVIGYLFYIIGGFAITAFLSVLAVVIKSPILNFGVGILILLFPLFIPSNGMFGTIGVLFPDMSMQANTLFQDMQAVNFLGKPILLCYVAPIVSLAIGIFMCAIHYKVYIKGSIE